MTRQRWLLGILLVSLGLGFLGCSPGRRLGFDDSEKPSSGNQKILVDAYLFDAKLRRRGKPTTVRLDVYQTDSVVALYGRGYFNKGAFQGRLTDDSMQIYFPSIDEYFFDSIEKLFSSFKCENDLSEINLLRYFVNVPDTVDIDSGLNVRMTHVGNDERKFSVSAVQCNWRLALNYSREGTHWRLEEFSFDDGGEVTVKGKRRKYKSGVHVSAGKFQIDIPAGAIKISL